MVNTRNGVITERFDEKIEPLSCRFDKYEATVAAVSLV